MCIYIETLVFNVDSIDNAYLLNVLKLSESKKFEVLF